MGAKYRNKKVTVDGETFDSLREYRRYKELKLMEQAGEICDLQRQVKFVLVPVQREPDTTTTRGKVKTGKVIEREVSYLADFAYMVPTHGQEVDEDGGVHFWGGFELVVEDTKGFRTKDYIIKRKLMLWVHGIKIKEV